MFEKFTAVETICRREAMKIWEALVKNLPPKNSEQMPDDIKEWIMTYYKSKRGEKSIFKRMARINFEESKGAGSFQEVNMISQDEAKKSKTQEK